MREAIDDGDVPRAREPLRSEPALATALIAAPDIEPTSPLTYVGMVRFYGYADHERTGELAEVLMQAAADKDDETKNGSPLICAASHGDVAVVRALINAGADVELSDADAPSDTALRVSAAFGFPEIVDELIAAGAKINSAIEAAGAGDMADWSIDELSDFDRACALRAAAVNERLVDHRPASRRRHTDRRRGGWPARHPLGSRAGPIEGRRTPRYTRRLTAKLTSTLLTQDRAVDS